MNGIGLFHSSAYPDTEEKKEARRKSISIIREYGSAPFIEQSTPNLFSEFSKKNRKAVIDELIVRYSGFDPLALISYYEAMIARPERTGILKSTVNPIMFIIGEEDKAVPLQHSLEQCHVPFCSFIYISKDTAHMGMIEDTDASNNFIRKFLDYVTKTSPK